MDRDELILRIDEAIKFGLIGLDLSNNNLSELPPEISKLQTLYRLDLSGNELTGLPHELAELHGLKNLDLSKNRFSELPPVVPQLTNLTELDLSANGLTDLPSDFGDLANLSYLHISDNGLTSLPPEFVELQQLTDLNISDNNFVHIPQEIFQIECLTYLHVSDNQLISLPPEFSELKELIYLNLSNNKISCLPSEVAALEQLKTLDLSYNRITELPLDIIQANSMWTLDLQGNPDFPISDDILGFVTVEPGLLIAIYSNEMRYSTSQVRHSIEFPPEYKEAGISILSYFNHILNTKYPDMAITVTIEQKGTIITLIIDTPDGQQETIERELIQYGLVVTDKLPPEEYLSDPFEVMALKHKLDMADLEIKHGKDMLLTQGAQYEGRISSLEGRTNFLENMLSKEQSAKIELFHALTQLSSEASETNRQALDAILEIVKRGATESDETALAKDMKTIKKSDPDLYDKLKASALTTLTKVATSEAAKAIIGSLS